MKPTPWREEAISAAQRRIPPRPVTLRTPRDYRRTARWWELEAQRGYPSSSASARYGRNMRWAAELAGIYGPGTWLELMSRAGVKNPGSLGERPRGEAGAGIEARHQRAGALHPGPAPQHQVGPGDGAGLPAGG